MSKLVRLKTIKNNKKSDIESSLSWEEFQAQQCSHCGGAHVRACPRIKRMVFHTSGTLSEIEFWPDGEWDKTNVLWPESIVERGTTND
jgi:hypothetical protein